MIKVLVVEDNHFNMELVLDILNAQGYKVHSAADGEEAIKKVETDDYDLIIMDIVLPGMDGVEATKIIKSKPRYKDVPVIALTAYSLDENKNRSIGAGFDDYISKPIDVGSFVKTMEKYRIKWYEKIQSSIKTKEWTKPTGLSLLDTVMDGGLFSGSVVYMVSEAQIDSEVFLFHFTQPRKCFFISTERESKYIIQEMQKLGLDTSNIEFIDVFTKYHSPFAERKDEQTDQKLLEFVKNKLKSIKDKDITIIVDTFNFFPLLNVGRTDIKEFVNYIYNFAKTNDSIVYLLSLRNTIDSKLENEIMWQCDVVFDIRFVKTHEKTINELMITKAKNITLAADTIKFFIRGKVVIDSSREIV